MNGLEIIKTAARNTFRSRVRTILTILAIFVGAFTLTLTNGVGTGISRYIDQQVAALGPTDVIFIMSAELMEESGPASGPVEYDPDRSAISLSGFGGGGGLPAVTEEDIDAIAEIQHLHNVEPLKVVSPEFVTREGYKRWEIVVNANPAGSEMDVAAGRAIPSGELEHEILLPWSYLEVLGFDSPAEALGEEIELHMKSVLGRETVLVATVVGVQHDTIFAAGAVGSTGLIDEMYDAQMAGVPAMFSDMYAGAMAHLTPDLTAAQMTDLRNELLDAGYIGITVEDQLGAIHTIINAVIGVLNAFSVIALVAAGLGIVNTLLMSVQERTREIGLMKAMGMGAGSIFTLFSMEAVLIGLFGSVIGAGGAVIVGNAISTFLANGPLSDLQGLQIVAFDPLEVLGVIVLVMAIAFVAGTMPALRAARLHPIDALRYE